MLSMATKKMSVQEVANIAGKLAERLRLALVSGGVAVEPSASVDDMLRAAQTAALGQDKVVIALHSCLHWTTTVALRDEKRAELRERLGEPWAEMGFSSKDEEMANDLRDVIAAYLRLKERILERQKAREAAGAALWTRPVDVCVAAKYRTALVGLVDLIGEFDSSFGSRPHTVLEWSRSQVVLEIVLHDAGLADAEIAQLFGRPDAQAVAQARYRYRVKATEHNADGWPS